MATVEHGAVRQIWFAPKDDPSNKEAFLIRDDAYSEREVTFGRTMRLGDPVDLGPFGAWRQSNWSGGYDQEVWRDEAMFELGTADVSERRGVVKLWNGFTEVYGASNQPSGVVGLVESGASGTGENTPIVFAERTSPGGSGVVAWALRYWSPSAGLVSIGTATSQPMSLALLGAGYMMFGLADGTLLKWRQSTNTLTTETDVPGTGGIGFRSMATFNDAFYFLRGSSLIKRTSSPSTGIAYTPVATKGEISEGRGMVVWNNRLWFGAELSGGRSAIYVSDGYTVQQAFEVPGSNRIFDIKPHYGSLYIRVLIDATWGYNKARQQIWRYNGASLTMLYEDDVSDFDSGIVGNLETWGRFLVFPKHAGPTQGMEAGVWLYDAEEDALYVGPTVQADPDAAGVFVTAICNWNNTLVLAFKDGTTYTPATNDKPVWLAYLERTLRPRRILLDGTSTQDLDKVVNTVTTSFGNRSFNYPFAKKEQVILSSSYDAGLPGEEKVWLHAIIRCRIPQGCEVEVTVLHDDDPTEHPLMLLGHDGDSGWREVLHSGVCDTHGVHEKSSRIRYKLYLRNVAPDTYPTNTPEVDVVGLDFLPAPARRSQHHIRVLATDGQTLLGGTPNPKTTRGQIVGALKSYWNLGIPFLFWGPSTSGTPSGSGTEVMMSDYMEQSFRLDSEGAEVASEVSFNLLEITPHPG